MKGKKERRYKQRSNALPGTLQNFIVLPGSRFHAGKFDKAKTFYIVTESMMNHMLGERGRTNEKQ